MFITRNETQSMIKIVFLLFFFQLNEHNYYYLQNVRTSSDHPLTWLNKQVEKLLHVYILNSSYKN